MDNGRIEYCNKAICLFSRISESSSKVGIRNKLHCRFEVQKSFHDEGIKGYSVTNCYGTASVNDIEIGRIHHPSYFKLLSMVPEFVIELTDKELLYIELMRGNRDIRVVFTLKVLVSTDIKGSFEANELTEQDFHYFTDIPKSIWLEKFLETWCFFNANERVVPLNKINSKVLLRDFIAKARRNYYMNQYDSTLQTCYLALEALPNSIGFKDVKDMFANLSKLGLDKEKTKCIDGIYREVKAFNHLSRHFKLAEDGEGIVEISKNDAFLMLTMTELLLSYFLE